MANVNAGSKFYVCSTAQPNPLTAGAYAALTWVEVKKVGNLGETGTRRNILTYDTYGDDVSDKSKGVGNAGDPTLEVARVVDDPGQVIMRAIAATRFTYAFKHELADAKDETFTNSVFYNRGLVTGPTRPNGRVEDFQLEVFTLALIQKEVEVPSAVI